MSETTLEELKALVDKLSPEEKQRFYQQLKRDIEPHALEVEWDIGSDYILTAIQLSPDITRRGVRGILAEAKLGTDVIGELEKKGWREVVATTDQPYDYLIEDALGAVKIQVRTSAGRRESL